jgi:hypothetical protein
MLHWTRLKHFTLVWHRNNVRLDTTEIYDTNLHGKQQTGTPNTMQLPPCGIQVVVDAAAVEVTVVFGELGAASAGITTAQRVNIARKIVL